MLSMTSTGNNDIDGKDRHGVTALILASVTNQPALVQTLLASGADPNISSR